MTLRCSAVVLLLLGACTPRAKPVVLAPADAGSLRCDCAGLSAPREVGTVDAQLNELSGLVASRTQPGVYFAHNDSGDSARVFAITLDGAILQTFDVAGASNVDWEDLAIGPCPSGTCLVVGDIGDNRLKRDDYRLYRFTEPRVGGPAGLTAEVFPFHYPLGAHHNAEALIVQPVTGVAWVITKEASAVSEVYRVPLSSPGVDQEAQPVARLTVPGPGDGRLTGADLSPCGTVLALRMYQRLVLLTLPEGAAFEEIFRAPPRVVPSAQEAQSEAVAFSADGRSIITTSETVHLAPPIWASTCQ